MEYEKNMKEYKQILGKCEEICGKYEGVPVRGIYEENVKEYDGTCGEYEEICGKFEGIPPTILFIDSGTWRNSEISPSI